MGMEFDFSGYATRNDLLCADGRTIRKNAFMDQDGATVPIVWNHDHSNPDAVLGHAILENRDDGVYAYGKFNDTPSGQNAKELVMHGDVRSLSIWANKLKQVGGDVIHGKIRELSLVLAGANPGAYIDFIMAHSDDEAEDALIANYDENALTLYHSDKEDEKGEAKVAEETKKTEAKEKTIGDVFDEFTEEQKQVVYAMIGQALEDAKNESASKKEEPEKKEEVKHSDEEVVETETAEETEEVLEHAEAGEKTIGDVFNEMTEEQKKVVYFMIGEALAEKENVEHSEGGVNEMKTNVFDNTEAYTGEVLSHSEFADIISNAKRGGSLKEAFIAHGIEDINIMFPDHKSLMNEPEFIKDDNGWVTKVMGGVHHTPFSRIKTIFADITGEKARALGYIKGNEKKEEIFKLLKRTTNPTTVYKKQALDRDDVLDLEQNFNLLLFLKKEMRMKLDEELARAILIGDGRDPVEEEADKINEECIRPIWTMEDLFTVKVAVEVKADITDDDRARAFIKACKKSRKNYKGSGNPTMFMPEDMLTDCLLIEDKNGRVIYDTIDKLKAALRVADIVPVPVMENLTRTDKDEVVHTLAGMYVNLKDYNVGTDRGGELNFFEDFDIDFNKMKYLMEGRMSGSLIKPHSAVVIEFVPAGAQG